MKQKHIRKFKQLLKSSQFSKSFKHKFTVIFPTMAEHIINIFELRCTSFRNFFILKQ